MSAQALPSKLGISRHSLSPTDLSRRIKEQTRLLGFEKVGIVPVERLVREEERLREWLMRGYQGEMHWMAREPETRADPRRIFPAAQSVIAVALNYQTPYQHTGAPGTGKVSRYAWGDDYHQVVGAKLRQLLSWVHDQVPEAEGKVCCDIQPVMDKVWAGRAGLGWIGKHTNLITPEFGSWVFLGELLLNIVLEYDTHQIEDHCGSCTLCIDACPTQAITEPYVLDSTKCISYATIELREPEIPDGVVANLDGWLYGCDVCQEVCPWNRFEQVTPERAFEPRSGITDANLGEMLDLTPESYAVRFRHSAMKRAKLSGLQRNARHLIENQSKAKN